MTWARAPTSVLNTLPPPHNPSPQAYGPAAYAMPGYAAMHAAAAAAAAAGNSANGAAAGTPGSAGAHQPMVYDPLAPANVDKMNMAYMHRWVEGWGGGEG